MDYSEYKDKSKKSIRIIELSSKNALDALMSNDFYCTTELPEYFDFLGVLKYAAESIGDKSLNECINGDCHPESLHGVNLDVITNKDGRYAVRPLTLANPFLYYMLARGICGEQAWTAIKRNVSNCSIAIISRLALFQWSRLMISPNHTRELLQF